MFQRGLAHRGPRGTSRGGARPTGLPLRPVVQSKMAATMKKAVSVVGPGSWAAWARRWGAEEMRGGVGAEETRGAGGRGSEEMRYLRARGHGMRSAGKASNLPGLVCLLLRDRVGLCIPGDSVPQPLGSVHAPCPGALQAKAGVG